VRAPRPRLGRPKPADVSAGLVTGLFSIPEGMAYAAIAQAAGIGPRPAFTRMAERTGLAGHLGPDGVLPASPVLSGALDEAVARGERWLAGHPEPDGRHL